MTSISAQTHQSTTSTKTHTGTYIVLAKRDSLLSTVLTFNQHIQACTKHICTHQSWYHLPIYLVHKDAPQKGACINTCTITTIRHADTHTTNNIHVFQKKYGCEWQSIFSPILVGATPIGIGIGTSGRSSSPAKHRQNIGKTSSRHA